MKIQLHVINFTLQSSMISIAKHNFEKIGLNLQQCSKAYNNNNWLKFMLVIS